MKFYELVADLDKASIVGDRNIEIKSIAYDSRRLEAGGLFVAIEGYKEDGHKYVAAAVKKGAAGLIVEKEGNYPLPYVKVNDSRLALAKVAACFYDYPAEKMNMIGITGTNGKTTTAYMIEKIFQEGGYKTGLIGTIAKRCGNREFVGDRTTPESLDLHRIFATIEKEGCTHLVMEVSSHSLKLSRVAGILFDTVIFTNLTPEHGEFHPSFADYEATKMSLFRDNLKENGTAVINKDDPLYKKLVDYVNGKIISYTMDSGDCLRGKILRINQQGMELAVDAEGRSALIKLNMTGYFNAYNSLAAIGACLSLGLDLAVIKKGLESLQGVPGRFETIAAPKGFSVVIDYAHSPDGLKNLLKSACRLKENRLIVVFGCGGDRDPNKRPLMGEIAANFGDVVVVTSDNPRSENANAIIDDILVGIPAGKKVLAIADREAAIKAAVAIAEKGDLVVIAGKGHETEQIIGREKIFFNDKLVVQQAIEG